MRTVSRLMLVLCLLFSVVLTGPTQSIEASQQNNTNDTCQEGEFENGALWLICIPDEDWNGDLVVFAHGYVAFNQPIDFYNLEFNDVYLPDLVQLLGFAFATTSYRQNGLTILEGAEDIQELVEFFPQVSGQEPRYTYMTGPSQGGIITTLLMEQSPELFSGGLALCGPVGDFQRQLDYIGDFRLLFDYFFPNTLPGGPTAVPSELIDNWETVYVPLIKQIVADNPDEMAQLIRVSGAAVDPNDPATIETTTLNLLWYNAFTTNDAVEKLNGNPYDNIGRQYEGSDNDVLLNQSVPRFAADPAATTTVQQYETTGKVTKPLVMMHTSGDEIIPSWHQDNYVNKVQVSGDGYFHAIPIIERYGHCQFKVPEILAALAILVLEVTLNSNDSSIATTNNVTMYDVLRDFSDKSDVSMRELVQSHRQLQQKSTVVATH